MNEWADGHLIILLAWVATFLKWILVYNVQATLAEKVLSKPSFWALRVDDVTIAGLILTVFRLLTGDNFL